MSNHKLLLADDSVTIQKVVNLTFADEGIEVISVGDGNSAMEKFVEITPDLVMVDVNMPGVDGYRICEMIKQDIETKHVPVILLVGSFEPFDEDEARRVGANDYLTKPFQSIRQLVNKVTMLLNRDNGTPSAEAEPEAPARPESYQPNQQGELGDAGMDDEMIQTNQVGSLPIADVTRFSGDADDAGAGHETRNVEYPLADMGQDVPISDLSATQPLSSEDFERITSAGEPEQTEAEDHKDDLDAYLDEQMVSEFASGDEPETGGSDQEVINAPFGRENFYAPVEIPEPNPFTPEEVTDTTYSLQENPTDEPIEEVVRDYEIVNNKPFGKEASDEKFDFTEFTSVDEYFADDAKPNAEPIVQDSSYGEAAFYTEPDSGQMDEAESDSSSDSSDDNFEHRQNLAGWETVVDPEEYFKKRDQEQSREFLTEPDGFVDDTDEEDFAPVIVGDAEEIFADSAEDEAPEIESVTAQPEAEFVGYFSENQPVDHTEYEPADEFVEEPDPIAEAESRHFADDAVDGPVEIDDEPADEFAEEPDPIAEAESRHFADDAVDEPVEIEDEPADIADIVEESAVSETEQSAAGENEEVAEAPETIHAKVSSLVSNKDTTDTVESVIVSEFARQSISLSSEAIETIASKIADRISEKIVQEMAAEVVSDLADLIVAKMERKKLG